MPSIPAFLDAASIKTLCDLAVQAGDIIMEYYAQGAVIEYKEDDSPVTEADKAGGLVDIR